MQRRVASVLLGLTLALGSAACSNSDNPTSPTSDDTPYKGTAPTQTTTSTSVTAPGGPVTSPEAAASGLFAAWQRGDSQASRDDASHYARPRAVDNLFAHPYTAGGAKYTNQGCEAEGGQYICLWTYEGGALQMTVERVLGNGGFVVDNVVYRAD